MAGQAAKLVARQCGQGGAAYWLYEHEYEGGITELFERLDAMLREDRRMEVTAMILICKEDMLGSLDGRSRPPFSADVVRLDREAGMASVSVGGEGAGGPCMVRIAKMQDPFVYLAVTDGSDAFVDRVLEPFVKSLYPGVSEAALSSAEMRGALNILERRSGCTVRIAGVEACLEQDGAGGSSRGGPDAGEGGRGPSAACEDAPYRDALDEAAEGGRRIGGVQMRLVRDGAPRWSARSRGAAGSGSGCRCGRSARARCPTWRAWQAARPSSTRGALGWKTAAASGRSIILDGDMFWGAHENYRFVRIVRSMPRTMGSTYCANPYVHMSLVDCTDGSSFDVWVATVDRITIIPQIKATHAAVARLVNHIFERFGEGRVEEHVEEC